ncbi:rhodanese-like domain-containing protein [Niveibacterium sp. SC-1]|uniref:rhodanese-like domain-containing protein n=1 Tax=Niveibacterium sp. SC-1 TaxID=3135646 RepID=UPI00311ECC63
MRQISAGDLAVWLADANRDKPELLDVREPWETEICKITDSRLIPMSTVPMRVGELDPDKPLVVICHHGARSAQVGYFLERNGFAEVINLAGGVAAWAEQVDPAMARY